MKKKLNVKLPPIIVDWEPADKAKKEKPKPKSKGSPLFLDWSNGMSIHELVKKYSLKRSAIRRQLTDAAGGKDAFKALRQAGAGGTTVAFGGKRATNGSAPLVAANDAKARRITSTESWKARREFRNVLVDVSGFGSAAWREEIACVFIAPDQREYVRARANENADLIVDYSSDGLPPVRLRLLEGSSVAKKVKKEEKQIERGTQLLAATRARKRSARAARKQRTGAKKR